MAKKSRRSRQKCPPQPILAEHQDALIKQVLCKLSEYAIDAKREPGVVQFLELCREWKKNKERISVRVPLNNGSHLLTGTLPRHLDEAPDFKLIKI